MSLATGKQLHTFIWTELPINDKVIYRVNGVATKKNQTEITKGYSIFEWISGIPITDKDDETQNKDNEIASTHKYEGDDDITKNGREEKIIEEETYEDEYPSDRENGLSDNITENQDQTDQEDATVKNYGTEKLI